MLSLGKLLDLTLAGREPAEKTQVTVAGTRLRWLGEGVLEVRPAERLDSGLDLLLSAGLHGTDTVPVELLERLLHAIASAALVPRAAVLFVFGNPAALRRGERFVEQDIAVLFNGQHAQSSGAEALRAAQLEQHARSFFGRSDRTRRHINLHGNARASKFEPFAVYPYAPEQHHTRQSLSDLAAAGVQAVLLQRRPSFTFSAFTYQALDAQAFTLEVNQSNSAPDRPWPAQLEAYLTQLIEAGAQPGASPSSQMEPALFRIAREIVKLSDSFRLALSPEVENFTEVSQGTVLAEDLANVRWVVEGQNARILFPNPKVHNGLRAGLVVVPDTGADLI